jgi:hypothetical protein
MVVSSNKWVGGNNIIAEYIKIIHKYNEHIANIPIFKNSGKNKVRHDVSNEENRDYLNRIKTYEEHMLDERSTDTRLNDIDIINWVSERDADTKQAVYSMMDFNVSQS